MTDPNDNLPRILVVAPMKSGSTYVGNVLARYFGITEKIIFPANFEFGAEHNLTPQLTDALRGHPFSFNYHMLPYQLNLTTAAAERIALVGLWRNVADMLLSFDEHAMRKGENGPGVFYIVDHEKYRLLPPQVRVAFTIDTVTNWYVTFYLRWRQANMVLHPYEEMLRDQRAYFVDLLIPLLSHPPLVEQLDAILAVPPKATDRFNVGEAGRSASVFDEPTKRRLEERIFQHPDLAQLEILLWELPWEVPALAPRSALDGQVVCTTEGATPHFVSRGSAYPISRPSWLLCRSGARRTPRVVDVAELARIPVGEELL